MNPAECFWANVKNDNAPMAPKGVTLRPRPCDMEYVGMVMARVP